MPFPMPRSHADRAAAAARGPAPAPDWRGRSDRPALGVAAPDDAAWAHRGWERHVAAGRIGVPAPSLAPAPPDRDHGCAALARILAGARASQRWSA